MVGETPETSDKTAGCGLFGWRPAWLQRCLTYKYYVLVYMMMSISQSMVFSYITVVLSTIEKQFGLKVINYINKTTLNPKTNHIFMNVIEIMSAQHHEKL